MNQPSQNRERGRTRLADLAAQYRHWWPLWLITLVGGFSQWLVGVIAGGWIRGLATPAAPSGIVSLELAHDAATTHAILTSWAGRRIMGATVSVLLDFVFILGYAFLLRRLCLWSAKWLHPKRNQPLDGFAGRLVGDVAWIAGRFDALGKWFLRRLPEKSRPWLIGEETVDLSQAPEPHKLVGSILKRPDSPRTDEVGAQLAGLLGPIVAQAQIFAGLFDVAENLCLLSVLIPTWIYGTPPPHLHFVWWGGIDLPAWLAFKCAIIKFALIGMGVTYVLAGIRFHPWTEGALKVAGRARFSFYISLLAALVLLVPPGQDGLRTLAEDISTGNWFHAAFFLLAALIFGWLSWWGARAVELKSQDLERARLEIVPSRLPPLYVDNAQRKQWYDRGVRQAHLLLPRICAGLPFALFALATFRSLGKTDSELWLYVLLIVLFLFVFLIPHLFTQRRRTLTRARSQGKGDWWSRALTLIGPESALGDGSSPIVWVLRLLPFTCGIALWVIAVFYPLAISTLGSAAVLLFGLGLFIPFGSLMVYLTIRTRFPFLPVLFGAALAFGIYDLADNHRVRECGPESLDCKPVISKSFMKPPVKDLNAKFTAWLKSRPDRVEGKPYPVVFVAAAGGGIRAAYQTSHVLAAIQQEYEPFAAHTFLISSVSGGSLGSAVFASMMDVNDRFRDQDQLAMTKARTYDVRRFRGGRLKTLADTAGRDVNVVDWVDVADNTVGRDLLAPPMAGLLTADMVQRFVPVVLRGQDSEWFDRAYALELGLESAFQSAALPDKPNDATANPLIQSFYRSYVDKEEREKADSSDNVRPWAERNVPALFLNTANVEKGDRIVVASFAPCRMDDKGCIPSSDQILTKETETRRTTDKDGMWNVAPGINGLRTLAGIAPDLDLRLSTAACLSARFPLISPSATLNIRQNVNTPAPPESNGLDAPTRVKQRLVDGGYYENSGFSTVNDVLELLDAGKPVAGRSDQRPPWYPVVIQIDFEGSPAAPPKDGAITPSGYPDRSRPSTGLLDWAKGFVNASGAHGDLAKSRLANCLQKIRFDMKRPEARIYPVTFIEDKVPLPLNWLISAKSRLEIQYQTGFAYAREFGAKALMRERQARDSAAEKHRKTNQGNIRALLTALTVNSVISIDARQPPQRYPP